MADEKENGKQKSAALAALKFDFGTITAFEVDDFLKAWRGSDIRQQAKIIARYCTACPPEWGKPDDPETFGKRPWHGEDTFTDVRNVFLAVFQDPAKN